MRGEPVQLDRFTLISQAGGFAGALAKGGAKQLLEAGAKEAASTFVKGVINKAGEDAWDAATGGNSSADGGTPVPSTPAVTPGPSVTTTTETKTVTRGERRVTIESGKLTAGAGIGGFLGFLSAMGTLTFSSGADTTTSTTTTTTTTPNATPVSPATPNAAPATPDGGTQPDASPLPPDGGAIMSPPDASTPPLSTGATVKFDEIMKQYLAMSFPDSASAAAWLQQQTGEAGIEVKLTGNGFEVEEKLPDPTGVADTLLAAGVTDATTIRVGVYEANQALQKLDQFMAQAQAAMGSDEGPAQESDEATSDASDAVPSALKFVPQWEQYVPDSFALDTNLSASIRSALDQGRSTALKDNLGAQVLMRMEHTTRHGLVVQATVSTEIIDTLASEQPGFYAEPNPSFFPPDSTWQLRA